MNHSRAGFIDGRAVSAALGVLLIVGFLAGVVLVGLPGYFLGRHHGKEAALRDAIQRGHLIERYDPQTGVRIREWRP